MTWPFLYMDKGQVMSIKEADYSRWTFSANKKPSILNSDGREVFVSFIEIVPDAIIFESNDDPRGLCRRIAHELFNKYDGRILSMKLDENDSYYEELSLIESDRTVEFKLNIQLILDQTIYLLRILTVIR